MWSDGLADRKHLVVVLQRLRLGNLDINFSLGSLEAVLGLDDGNAGNARYEVVVSSGGGKWSG